MVPRGSAAVGRRKRQPNFEDCPLAHSVWVARRMSRDLAPTARRRLEAPSQDLCNLAAPCTVSILDWGGSGCVPGRRLERSGIPPGNRAVEGRRASNKPATGLQHACNLLPTMDAIRRCAGVAPVCLHISAHLLAEGAVGNARRQMSGARRLQRWTGPRRGMTFGEAGSKVRESEV